MSGSFTKLHADRIFRTKNRRPFLGLSIHAHVHACLATIIRGMDVPYVLVGGVADRVHILFDMGKPGCSVRERNERPPWVNQSPSHSRPPHTDHCKCNASGSREALQVRVGDVRKVRSRTDLSRIRAAPAVGVTTPRAERCKTIPGTGRIFLDKRYRKGV